jgi:8-oxo-dGTP diphosphatase
MLDPHLYHQIVRALPIACVDLFVVNQEGKLLLIKRKNEPGAGYWWFPGGRIFHGELRIETVNRKLKEECGLVSDRIIELGTYDVIIPVPGDYISHAVTTVYQVLVTQERPIRLDDQSESALWLFPDEWQNYDLHPFVRSMIARFQASQ